MCNYISFTLNDTHLKNNLSKSQALNLTSHMYNYIYTHKEHIEPHSYQLLFEHVYQTYNSLLKAAIELWLLLLLYISFPSSNVRRIFLGISNSICIAFASNVRLGVKHIGVSVFVYHKQYSFQCQKTVSKIPHSIFFILDLSNAFLVEF